MLTLASVDTGYRLGDDLSIELFEAGSGPTLLLLHGVEGGTADSAVVAELAKSHHVVVPSHPGFGTSPRPEWCDGIDDLAYLYLDWLEAEDLHDVVLVGLQFGGWLAAELAIRDTSRLSRVVLVDPVGIKVGGREDRDIADVFSMSRASLNEKMYFRPENRPNYAQTDDETVMRAARNEEALALYGWQPYLHNPGLGQWLHRIDVPTMVIWGQDDGIVSAEYGQRFANLIPSARFETIADAGHCAQIDQPARVADLVTRFSA